MPVRFSPYRQGATHSLDSEDLVFLRGTPYYSDRGEFDTRILVKNTGYAMRALWWSGGDGKSEFHQWECRLEKRDCDDLRILLDDVARNFAEHSLTIDGNESGDILTFWVGESRFHAALHTGPPEMLNEYSQSKIEAFAAVAQSLYALVPQREVTRLDERRYAEHLG
jgi:hypothetical protein